MLRATLSEDGCTLQVEGVLTAREIGVLSDACRAVAPRALVLDLAGLGFVDHAGAIALAEMARRGARIRGASNFVEEFLREMAT
jgi:anti-anti-sigma regulatory factor